MSQRHDPSARSRPELAQTNVERSRNLFERQLLPKQTLDDNEARYQSARGAARSGARAEHAVEGAARRAAHQPGQHLIVVAGQRLRRPARGRSRRVRRPERAGGGRRRHHAASASWSTSSRRTCKQLAGRRRDACRSGCVPRRDVHRPDRARGARARPRDAHGADRDRDSESRLPAEARHVCARQHHHRQRKDALVVPTNAVVDFGGRRGVFLAAERTRRCSVRCGSASRKTHIVEILGGLAEGDASSPRAPRRLRDGDRIVLRARRGPAARRQGGRAADSGATAPRCGQAAGAGTAARPASGGDAAGPAAQPAAAARGDGRDGGAAAGRGAAARALAVSADGAPRCRRRGHAVSGSYCSRQTTQSAT